MLINSYRFAAASPTGDPFFANVSLLLHGNGTNGSTTIKDKSPSPKTVTAVGNAQISTAIADPFGNSTRGVLALDGTGDYLTHTAFAISPGVDFTLELFLYKTAKDANPYTIIFGNGGTTQVGYDQTTVNSMYFYTSTGGLRFTPAVIALNSWIHLAWTRQGSTLRLFANGLLQLTGSYSGILNFTATGGASFGYEVNGYMSEIRVTQAARYTANFTPPTAPFPDS